MNNSEHETALSPIMTQSPSNLPITLQLSDFRYEQTSATGEDSEGPRDSCSSATGR